MQQLILHIPMGYDDPFINFGVMFGYFRNNNGQGFYHIESGLTDYRRMDIVVDYNTEQFIIELKLWNGESMHNKAYEQLIGYLDKKGAAEGYLLTFNLSKNPKRHEPQWVQLGNKRIFDVVV